MYHLWTRQPIVPSLLCSRAQSALLCTQHVCWSIQGTRNRHFFYEDLHVSISNPELPFPSNTGLNASRSLLGSSVIRICNRIAAVCLPLPPSLNQSSLEGRKWLSSKSLTPQHITLLKYMSPLVYRVSNRSCKMSPYMICKCQKPSNLEQKQVYFTHCHECHWDWSLQPQLPLSTSL